MRFVNSRPVLPRWRRTVTTVSRWALVLASAGGWVAAAVLYRATYLLRRALETLTDELRQIEDDQ